MKLGSEYCKQLRDAFRRHANFPPDRPIALGDFGVVQDNVFERLGNIAEFGISLPVVPGTGQAEFTFKSQGSVGFELIGKGELLPGGVPAARAGLHLTFSRENAVFFSAAGCTVQAIGSLLELESALIALLDEGRWETEFYVVTEINQAAKTTAIVASSSNSEVRLEASSPALESIQLGDVSLELQVKKSLNTSMEVVAQGSQVPLMQLSRLRGFFRQQLRPSLGAVAMPMQSAFQLTADPDTVSTPTIEEPAPFGAVAAIAETAAAAAPVLDQESARFMAAIATPRSDFDLHRALGIHMPLLAASYALYDGVENPELPPGVEAIGRIMAEEERGAIAIAAVQSPEAQRSLENDLRALGLGAERGALAGVNNPDAFGFVALEKDTGDYIVSIRGTQTAEEWVKDFTAIANPFNEVPGFGFVHLGFEIMWRRVRNSVLDALAGIPNGSRITFIGHSLGGAMAVLGAADIAVNMAGPRRWTVDMFTVGCPRPGGVRFRINFNRTVRKYFRITNQGDVVPHVPPVVLPPIFNHPGSEIDIVGRNGNAHSLPAYVDGLQALAGSARGAVAAAGGGIAAARTV